MPNEKSPMSGKKAGKLSRKASRGNPWVRLGGPQGPSTIVRRMTSVVTVVTGASSSTIIKSGGVTSAIEWSGVTAAWQEYRVLAMRLQFSTAQYATGSVANVGDWVVGTDKSAALAAQTSGGVFALENAKVFDSASTESRLASYEARATDLEDQLFNPVGTTASTFAIHVIQASGVSLAVYVEYAVELRGAQS